MAELERATALAHLGEPQAAIGTVTLREIADRALIDLRIGTGEAVARRAMEAALGLPLPDAPRTSTAHGGRAALWLSFDRWLASVPLVEEAALSARLTAAARSGFAAATVVSDARTILRLAGPGCREIVMKGAPIDLTTGMAGAGFVRRLDHAGLDTILHVVAGSPDVIDLYVPRSIADYAWRWLAAAARPAASLQLFKRQDTPTV